MARTNQNFSMYCGETKNINFTFTAENEIALNESIIKWALLSGGSIKIIKDSASGGISISGNVCTILLDPIDTIDLRPGIFQHELEITNNSGKVFVGATGRCNMKEKLIK